MQLASTTILSLKNNYYYRYDQKWFMIVCWTEKKAGNMILIMATTQPQYNPPLHNAFWKMWFLTKQIH